MITWARTPQPHRLRASRPAAATTATAGLVKVGKKAGDARNPRNHDSLLLTDHCGAHTPIPIFGADSRFNTEATTSKIGEDQIFCNQRGLGEEEAISLIMTVT